jgi:uncharacterized membrane protein
MKGAAMGAIKAFVKTSVIGGVAVILPAVILLFIFSWLFNRITDVIQPLTDIIIVRGHFQEMVADILVIIIIVAICFLVGALVKTGVGKFIHENLEDHILNLAPGYPTIKAVVMQFVGRKKSPFSSVALVQVFGNEILMTAFITDTHDSGRHTVFVPTGPNPTSGLIFHVPRNHVHPVRVSVEEAMRSVIGCGAGSTNLINGFATGNTGPCQGEIYRLSIRPPILSVPACWGLRQP